MTLYDNELKTICSVHCDLEPVFLACGPRVVALGLNNHAWLYSATEGRLLRKLQYAGSVDSILVSETHVAALVDGKVYLQLVKAIPGACLCTIPSQLGLARTFS